MHQNLASNILNLTCLGRVKYCFAILLEEFHQPINLL